MKNLFIAILSLLACAGAAQAHTHLKTAVPANNAVLATPPGELKLEFSKSARFTALSLQKEGESQKQEIAGLPKEAATVLSVPLAPLPAGKYTVNWRVVGDDNHVMSGVLRFTVNAQ